VSSGYGDRGRRRQQRGRDKHAHGNAQLAGRYWPTFHVEVPRLPDGKVDIRALCRRLDEAMNGPEVLR
jgi:hypothetical protein